MNDKEVFDSTDLNDVFLLVSLGGKPLSWRIV